jgi:hypothetical protein
MVMLMVFHFPFRLWLRQGEKSDRKFGQFALALVSPSALGSRNTDWQQILLSTILREQKVTWNVHYLPTLTL